MYHFSGLCVEYHHHVPTQKSTMSTVIISSSSAHITKSHKSSPIVYSSTAATAPAAAASAATTRTITTSTITSTSISSSSSKNENYYHNINNNNISNTDGIAKSRATKLWPGFVTTIVCICVFILLLFIVLFGLLQAKSSEKLCWRTRYAPVPTIYQNNHSQKVQFQNGMTKVPLGIDDYADEEETSSAWC